MAVGVFLSGGLVTVLAIIAPEIALLTLALMALTGFVLNEMSKRRMWERGTTSKLKVINENHDRLAKEVERQRYDIMFMREEMDMNKVGAPTQEAPRLAPAPRAPIEAPVAAAAPKPPPVIKKAPIITPASAINPMLRKIKLPRNSKQDLRSEALGIANQDIKADHVAISDTMVKELVHNAVRAKRIDVFVQPIMRLPQRKVRFYEVYARIRAQAGMYLPASRYMELARQDRLMDEIDHLLLMQCLKTLRDTAALDRAAPFFINITPSTLTNMIFMRQLLSFLSENRSLAPRLVFEIKQADFNSMKPSILEILRGLGRLGCALSIDHVTTLDVDLKFLQVLKVRYIKISARHLLARTKTDKDFNVVERQKRKLEGNGIGFIVEKIENETMLRELLDFGINYGQGYLFGKPDLQGAYRQQAIDAA